MNDSILCPECAETVRPIVRDDTGYRCPLCRQSLDAVVDEQRAERADVE